MILRVLTPLLLVGIFSNNILANDNILLTDQSYISRTVEQNLHLQDGKVLLAYILSRTLPDLHCPFDPKSRIQKEAVKYTVRRFLAANALDIAIEVSPNGYLSLLTTDQALELGYVLGTDVIHHSPKNVLFEHAFKTYGREKMVGILLWLWHKSNLEDVFPRAISDSELYHIVKKELLRYGIDKLFCNNLN